MGMSEQQYEQAAGRSPDRARSTSRSPGRPQNDLNKPCPDGSKNSDAEDRRLAEAAQKGEMDAFGELVKKYQRQIYDLARGMTNGHSDADDLAQEVFIKAWRAIGRYRFQAAFYTWLYRIAVNTIITRIKQKKRLPHSGLDSLENYSHPYPAPFMSRNPEDGVDRLRRWELSQALERALESLSPRHRAVVVMHEMEDFSHGEIARVLKISEGTVRSRLHYARNKLKKKLRPYLD